MKTRNVTLIGVAAIGFLTLAQAIASSKTEAAAAPANAESQLAACANARIGFPVPYTPGHPCLGASIPAQRR